jgi:hypothetical protein
MHLAAQIVFKALLEDSKKKEQLLRFLSDSEQEEISKLPDITQEISSNQFLQDGLLDSVHYSWLIPTLKSYSKEEGSLFLLALSGKARENLKLLLKKRSEKCELSEIGQKFLRKVLLDTLIDKEDGLLPIDYLPESPLNVILTLSKQDTVRLIDFLSLYDLVLELRQIVETKTLKKIYTFLSAEKRDFLKNKMNYTEPPLFPKLGLEMWDGKEESLKIILHKRGLNRLANALSNADSNLVWYLCHHLDIGRGTTLFKLSQKKVSEKVAKIIIGNIMELLPIVKR